MTDMFVDLSAKLDKEVGPATGQAVIDKRRSITAVGRFAQCEEIEGLIHLLASDCSGFMTGGRIAFDGGQSIMPSPNLASL